MDVAEIADVDDDDELDIRRSYIKSDFPNHCIGGGISVSSSDKYTLL